MAGGSSQVIRNDDFGGRPAKYLMIKRSHFKSNALAYLLITPQVLVTVAFFYWPAVQGLLQSLVLMILIVTVTVLQFRFVERRVQYTT